MSLLKTIGKKIQSAEKKIKKAEKQYQKMKKGAKPITGAAVRAFDYLIPPPKKKGKKGKVKMFTCKNQR